MACPVTMSSLRDSEQMWGDASLLHTGHPSGIQEEEHHFSDSLLESSLFNQELLWITALKRIDYANNKNSQIFFS